MFFVTIQACYWISARRRRSKDKLTKAQCLSIISSIWRTSQHLHLFWGFFYVSPHTCGINTNIPMDWFVSPFQHTSILFSSTDTRQRSRKPAIWSCLLPLAPADYCLYGMSCVCYRHHMILYYVSWSVYVSLKGTSMSKLIFIMKCSLNLWINIHCSNQNNLVCFYTISA